MLKVTPLAQEKLKEFLEARKAPDAYVRVYLSGIG